MKRLDSAAWYPDPNTNRLRLLMEQPADKPTRRRLRSWGFQPEGPAHRSHVWTAPSSPARQRFLRSL